MESAKKHIKEEVTFPSVTRYRSTGGEYDINAVLKLVEPIGKQRDPHFVIDKDNRFVYENVVKWLHGDTSMKALNPITREETEGDIFKGIYIAGGVGTGKTWCVDIMRAYAEIFDFRVKFGVEAGVLAWKSVNTADVVERYIATASIGCYKQEGIICFHDLGSEPLEATAQGNRLNVMKALIEHRGDRQDCLTLITSNFSLKDSAVERRYGERVVSRLSKMCNYYEMKGRDRRIYKNN